MWCTHKFSFVTRRKWVDNTNGDDGDDGNGDDFDDDNSDDEANFSI